MPPPRSACACAMLRLRKVRSLRVTVSMSPGRNENEGTQSPDTIQPDPQVTFCTNADKFRRGIAPCPPPDCPGSPPSEPLSRHRRLRFAVLPTRKAGCTIPRCRKSTSVGQSHNGWCPLPPKGCERYVVFTFCKGSIVSPRFRRPHAGHRDGAWRFSFSPPTEEVFALAAQARTVQSDRV